MSGHHRRRLCHPNGRGQINLPRANVCKWNRTTPAASALHRHRCRKECVGLSLTYLLMGVMQWEADDQNQINTPMNLWFCRLVRTLYNQPVCLLPSAYLASSSGGSGFCQVFHTFPLLSYTFHILLRGSPGVPWPDGIHNPLREFWVHCDISFRRNPRRSYELAQPASFGAKEPPIVP